MNITASKRLRRGFARIGIIGLVPAVLFSLGYIGKELWRPSGEILILASTLGQLADIDTEKLESIRGAPWLKNKTYEEIENTKRFVESSLREKGTRIKLIDGRQVDALIPELDKRSRAEIETSVNRSVISYEVSNRAPISIYESPYYAGVIVISCHEYSDCDAPFPNSSKSHLGRKFDFTTSLLSGVIGLIWYALFWIAGWVVAGFMKE